MEWIYFAVVVLKTKFIEVQDSAQTLVHVVSIRTLFYRTFLIFPNETSQEAKEIVYGFGLSRVIVMSISQTFLHAAFSPMFFRKKITKPKCR